MGWKGECEFCVHWNTKLQDPNCAWKCCWCSVKREYTLNSDTCSQYKENPNGSDYMCFLTTACVKHKHLPDDCKELTELRAFRDNYLSKTEYGRALIAEYYVTAPDIVTKIENSAQKSDIYNYIYDEIQKCLELIEQAKFDETTETYRTMVKTVCALI